MKKSKNWETWDVPFLNPTSNKWLVRHNGPNGKLIKLYEYDSKEEAEADMKKNFIDNLMEKK